MSRVKIHCPSCSVNGVIEISEDYLKNEGIGSLIHYPITVHKQEAYQYLGYKAGDFPNSEECANTVLSLPMFPELTTKEVEYVCKKIEEWTKQN